MCGIVAYLTAYSNGFGYNESKVFNNMLFLDTLRGWDSTGVFGVSNVGNVGILKAAINAPNFMQTQEYKDFMAEAVKNGMCLIGHNRAATRGSVTDANAHPFVIDDNIILVQNGTWNGSHKHIKDTEVDTETVAHIIHENENIEEALQKINAAYALIWYNVKEKSLYAIRNSQRPLFAALTKSGGTILASEANTILYSALREQVQLDGSPYELKPGYLNKWTLQSNKTWEFDGKDVDISYRPKYQSNHHQGYPFRHSFHGYMDYDDIDVEEPQHQPHHQTPWGTSTVTNTIGEIVRQGRLRDWETDEATAHALKLERDKIGTKEILLEFFDYLPCNGRKDCSAFYLVGKPITPEETKLCAYHLVQDISEQDVMQMVVDGTFTGTATTALIHKVIVEGTNKYVTTIFCHTLKPFKHEEQTAH